MSSVVSGNDLPLITGVALLLHLNLVQLPTGLRCMICYVDISVASDLILRHLSVYFIADALEQW